MYDRLSDGFYPVPDQQAFGPNLINKKKNSDDKNYKCLSLNSKWYLKHPWMLKHVQKCLTCHYVIVCHDFEKWYQQCIWSSNHVKNSSSIAITTTYND